MDWKIKVTSRHEVVKSQLHLESPLENIFFRGWGELSIETFATISPTFFHQYRRNKFYLKLGECLAKKIGISAVTGPFSLPAYL